MAPAPATAVWIYPVATTVGVDAFAVNTYIDPGISRSTNGGGPLADTASATFGPNSADAAAAADATGLHASAAVHADASNPNYTATALGVANLRNPFMLVPQAGFTGTQAMVRIAYTFDGSFNTAPSLQACPTCFGSVAASLSVDGLPTEFHFDGVHSLGTINNPTFVAGGVSLAGVLEGMLPVNTELYLRASLLARTYCQSDALTSCSADALFGGTLAYSGLSPDAVTLTWGLAPVPEAPAGWLFAGGLAALIALRRARGTGA